MVGGPLWRRYIKRWGLGHMIRGSSVLPVAPPIFQSDLGLALGHGKLRRHHTPTLAPPFIAMASGSSSSSQGPGYPSLSLSLISLSLSDISSIEPIYRYCSSLDLTNLCTSPYSCSIKVYFKMIELHSLSPDPSPSHETMSSKPNW
jgi:hypothetical protein